MTGQVTHSAPATPAPTPAPTPVFAPVAVNPSLNDGFPGAHNPEVMGTASPGGSSPDNISPSKRQKATHYPPADSVALCHRQMVVHARQCQMAGLDGAHRQHALQKQLDAQTASNPKLRYSVYDFNTDIKPLLQDGDTAGLHRFMRKKGLESLSLVTDGKVTTFYVPRRAKSQLWLFGSTFSTDPRQVPQDEEARESLADDLTELAARLMQAAHATDQENAGGVMWVQSDPNVGPESPTGHPVERNVHTFGPGLTNTRGEGYDRP